MRRLSMIIKGIIRRGVIKYWDCFFSIKKREDNIVKNILIVRTDEIGDIILTTPFFRELRRNYLDARIVLVVKPAVYNLVELCPYVNEIKCFKSKKQRFCFFSNLFHAYQFAVKELLPKNFDLAIVPRWDSDVAYFAGPLVFFSGACRRVAYSEHVSAEKEILDYGCDNYYTDLVPSRPGVVHEVERNLDVLRYLGCSIEKKDLEIWINDSDIKKAEKLLFGKNQ